MPEEAVLIMPAWRSAELESVFGGALDASGITSATIERLVHEHVSESDQLDFKGDLYARISGRRPTWTPEQEFAKDVASLANLRGGILMVGVQEVAGVATALKSIHISSCEDEERRLRQALVNFQAPLADCRFVWVEAGHGSYFLAVVVPPSRRSPHAVTQNSGDSQGTLRYPIRHGQDTNWLTESEVAERYRRRLSAQEDERQRIRRVVADGCHMLIDSDGVWLFVAVIPETQAGGSLDQATVESIWNWQQRNGLGSPLGRDLPTYGRPIPAPGRVTFTGALRSSSEDEAAIRDGYLELHVDGSAFAALPVSSRTEEDGDGHIIGEITTVDDGILLSDVASRWCAHQVGSWGTATAVIGLVEASEPDGALALPVTLAQSDTGKLQRIRGTRSVRDRPEAQVTVDLGAVDTLQQRLVVTYRLLSGLLQWFGLAEPAQLKRDGTIVARQFTMSRYTETINWAERQGVEVELLEGSSG